MVDLVETAHEHIHEAAHENGEGDPWPRRMAVVVSCLAAALALAEIGAKSSQTEYLTHHIAVSDTWNFYQAKNLRANLWSSQSGLLESLPNANESGIQDRIKTARSEEARLRDDPSGGEGMKQLIGKAERESHERDHVFHAYHAYELTAGALEIAIVLASVSVVTRIRQLGIAAGGLGMMAGIYGAAVFGHLV